MQSHLQSLEVRGHHENLGRQTDLGMGKVKLKLIFVLTSVPTPLLQAPQSLVDPFKPKSPNSLSVLTPNAAQSSLTRTRSSNQLAWKRHQKHEMLFSRDSGGRTKQEQGDRIK